MSWLVVMMVATASPEASTAKERVEAGNAAFARGEFQLALEAFTEAYALQPLPQLRFNQGMCLERLGRWLEAWESFDEAARRFEDSESRARTVARLDALNAKLARLRFEAEPGVSLEVDLTRRCETPCELRVEPGRHRWEARRGPGRAEGVVEAAAGEARTVAVSFPVVETPKWRLRWPFIAGAAVATVGAAGVVGFGLRSNQLLAEYQLAPTLARAEEGDRVTLAANVFLVGAIVGAVVVVLDLIFDRS